MMRMLIVSLLLAAPAMAAPPMPRWTPVPADGRTVEIDRASLTWRAMQRAWWRTVHAQPSRDGTVEERHLELVDCNTGTSAVIQTIALSAGGEVLRNQVDGESLAMQRLGPPTPGTVGEAVTEATCQLRPPPPPPKARAKRK